MFTLTINQTDSRRDGDRVPQLLKDLRHVPARLDFDRSVEDEVQGIVDCPHQAVEAALIALRCGSWYVGVGVDRSMSRCPTRSKTPPATDWYMHGVRLTGSATAKSASRLPWKGPSRKSPTKPRQF